MGNVLTSHCPTIIEMRKAHSAVVLLNHDWWTFWISLDFREFPLFPGVWENDNADNSTETWKKIIIIIKFYIL